MPLRRSLVVLLFVVLAAYVVPASGQTREEAILWTAIQNSTNPDDYRGYLDAYPNGIFAPLAKRRLATMEETAKKNSAAIEEADRAAVEAKRASLVGSEWEGREFYTRGYGGVPRTVRPGDSNVVYFDLVFSFSENGVCHESGRGPWTDFDVPCTWTKTGDTIAISTSKVKDYNCPTELTLHLENEGKDMVGTVVRDGSRSCHGGSYKVELHRIK
jgi:hypothetical protein